MSAQSKIKRRTRRKTHIRKFVSGSEGRPRLTVFRSSKHIYAQAIDDVTGKTIAQASSLNDELVTGLVGEGGGKISVGTAVGKAIASRLQEKSIASVVFDRNGYLYHGRVKAVADGVREAGIQV